jgi:DeoR family transcriptional regulator, suf operon transcriptional repressor
MQASRQGILNYLHHQGHATVRQMADLLGLTPTGVRQHLTVLERDGLVQSSEQRGHVGRPAFVFTLTERGEASFPTNYAMLANLLLEELRTMAGSEALQQLLRRVSTRMAERYSERVAGLPLSERVQVTAGVLREHGCDVEIRDENGEFFIQQCTCPYPEVARQHSAVCALEVGFVQRMTGADARLVGSLLRGDSACIYRVREDDAGHPMTPLLRQAAVARGAGSAAD